MCGSPDLEISTKESILFLTSRCTPIQMPNNFRTCGRGPRVQRQQPHRHLSLLAASSAAISSQQHRSRIGLRDTNCTPLDIIIPSSHTSKRSTIPSFIDHAFHLRGPSCHRWGACHEGRRRRQQPSPTIVVVVVHSLPSIGWWWCLLRSTTTHPTTTSNVPTILHFLLLLFHRTNSSPTIW